MAQHEILGFTVGGKEVVAVREHQERWLVTYRDPEGPELYRSGIGGLLYSLGHHLGLDGTWQYHRRYNDINQYDTLEEARAFAEQFRDDRPKGIKLPFQLAGRDVWINGDRLDYPSIQGSQPYYIGDGPEKQITAMWCGGSTNVWRTAPPSTPGGWVSYGTAQYTCDVACESAGVPKIDIKTLQGTPMTIPPLETMLGKQLIQLVKLSPVPHYVRGLILAETGLWPFPEVHEDDWDKEPRDVAAWLQANWKPMPKPAATITKASVAYEIEASYSERQHGRCNVSRTAYCNGTATFSNDDLRDEFGGLTRDEMRDRLREMVEEEDFDCNETSDYEYDDEEFNDSDGRDWDLPSRRLDSVIEEFLENNPDLDPDREEEEDEEEEEVEA